MLGKALFFLHCAWLGHAPTSYRKRRRKKKKWLYNWGRAIWGKQWAPYLIASEQTNGRKRVYNLRWKNVRETSIRKLRWQSTGGGQNKHRHQREKKEKKDRLTCSCQQFRAVCLTMANTPLSERASYPSENWCAQVLDVCLERSRSSAHTYKNRNA